MPARPQRLVNHLFFYFKTHTHKTLKKRNKQMYKCALHSAEIAVPFVFGKTCALILVNQCADD
jgi:hypothetical protein